MAAEILAERINMFGICPLCWRPAGVKADARITRDRHPGLAATLGGPARTVVAGSVTRREKL